MTTSTQAPAVVPGSTAHTDGAWSLIPVQTRSERPRSFDPADFAVPTGREVNWKHTPVEAIATLFHDAASDDRDGDPAVDYNITAGDGVELGSLRIGESPRGDVFEPEDIVAAIAWSRTEDALHVRIADGAEIDAPVIVRMQGSGAGRRANAHVVVEAGANSHATVLLRHDGAAAFAQNVEIIVRDGAHLELVSLQQWDDDAVHAASHQARVERDATLRHIVVSFGGAVVRVNPSVELSGTGARGELYGLSYSDSGQHLESQVYLHHKGADTTGDVLYKGALQGEGARSVWIGDVLIGPDAVGTDSYEANRNLVLTEGARADSIPNLEIETGDIRGAGHASATGRFDDEQLFYLQARGIAEDEARRLVVLGFLVEIVQKVGVPALEEELVAAIETELAQEVGR
ncbi:Fe-S cluster assembly protein SufD [Microbacterium hominis]|uniref:Fe-S cluster assembly protein SufD n=1 Tax=Microbacterium hominis TaxID=162426 RepID=A0A7D4PV94_9MICO|nr:Fe-S cluster assembly protein SufD [Microbacterium hominis]QKJ19594.1 Fe-S cluster assembly protein SufD [Microbacterium hominis]